MPRQLFCQPGKLYFLSCQFRVVSATTKLACAHARPCVTKQANIHISFYPFLYFCLCFLFLWYLKRSCVAFGSYDCKEQLSQTLRLRILFNSGLKMCAKSTSLTFIFFSFQVFFFPAHSVAIAPTSLADTTARSFQDDTLSHPPFSSSSIIRWRRSAFVNKLIKDMASRFAMCARTMWHGATRTFCSVSLIFLTNCPCYIKENKKGWGLAGGGKTRAFICRKEVLNWYLRIKANNLSLIPI